MHELRRLSFLNFIERIRDDRIHEDFPLSIVDADGDYHITSRSKAQIRHDGTVQWVC